jgi:hypothetical protein
MTAPPSGKTAADMASATTSGICHGPVPITEISTSPIPTPTPTPLSTRSLDAAADRASCRRRRQQRPARRTEHGGQRYARRPARRAPPRAPPGRWARQGFANASTRRVSCSPRRDRVSDMTPMAFRRVGHRRGSRPRLANLFRSMEPLASCCFLKAIRRVRPAKLSRQRAIGRRVKPFGEAAVDLLRAGCPGRRQRPRRCSCRCRGRPPFLCS